MKVRRFAVACLLVAAWLRLDGAAAEELPTRDRVEAPIPSPPVDFDAIERAIVGNRLTQARLMLAKLDAKTAQGPRFDLLLGDYYLAQRQDALALERFQRVLASVPASSPAARGAGIASLRLGQNEQARTYFHTAIELDPRDAQAWNGLGIIAGAMRDWDVADTAYRNALVIRSEDPTILNNYGYSLVLRRRFQEAVAMLGRAASAAPQDRVIRTNYELAQALSGNYPQSFDASDADDELARRLNNAGYAAWLNGDVSVARALLASAIEAKPAHYALAERNLALAEGSPAK